MNDIVLPQMSDPEPMHYRKLSGLHVKFFDYEASMGIFNGPDQLICSWATRNTPRYAEQFQHVLNVADVTLRQKPHISCTQAVGRALLGSLLSLYEMRVK